MISCETRTCRSPTVTWVRTSAVTSGRYGCQASATRASPRSPRPVTAPTAFGAFPSGPGTGTSGVPHAAGRSPSQSRVVPRTSCPSGTIAVTVASRSTAVGKRGSGTTASRPPAGTGTVATSAIANGGLAPAASRTVTGTHGPSGLPWLTPSTTSGSDSDSSPRHSAGTSITTVVASVRIGRTVISARTCQPACQPASMSLNL
ncbi:hypothetical protein [Frigoriglobus tundricola]|uniref:hypothetical protein n=1 Tax=Frigoriglobus tundricola TaxID=2774151 RepID=UPI00148EB250|nr:hypothetical protein [Frigoriglobus tundricola]